MIDFGPSELQLQLQQQAREYVERVLMGRTDLDRHEGPAMEVYEEAFRAGLMTAMLPRAVGGQGLAPLDLALAVEEVARGDLGVATSIFVTTLATGPLCLFGTPEQQQRWLVRLTERLRFCAFGWTEPEGSSNLFSRPASTTARPVEGGYRLSGAKCTITNAPVADFFVVFARVEGPGLCAFVVPQRRPG
jgi:alkylation response protein AidB-like acyl-CoA dehydrogenase